MPLSLFEQERQEIGMLIMDHKNHNGKDLGDFIVLCQIGFNWIMGMMVGTSVEENVEHGVTFLNKKNPMIFRKIQSLLI